LAQFAADAAARASQVDTLTDSDEDEVVPEPARQAPAALRVKGIDDEKSRPMTYTGPAEDGSAEVQREGGGGRHAAPTGSSRRERREAARRQTRGGPPKARRG
jgi:preprotein translocase subunit SecA